jgi:methanogenic corrinoid protein MtbC1
MIGGGPVTREYAEEIGADGYGKDAIDAVDEAKKLFSSATKTPRHEEKTK